MRSIIFLLLWFIAVGSYTAYAQDVPASDKLQVHDTGVAYQLTVPVSKLVVTIPKNNLVQSTSDTGGGTNSPRYFFFTDKDKAVAASGWFEPSTAYPGINTVWEKAKAQWERSGVSPQAVTFAQEEKWEIVSYALPLPNKTMSNVHILAHRVQAGTWIDLHLSVTSNASVADAKTQLLAMLKSINVQEK